MRRLMGVLAVLFVAGMASVAMGEAAAQIQMAEDQCNCDGCISVDEANHPTSYDPRAAWDLGARWAITFSASISSRGGAVFGWHMR